METKTIQETTKKQEQDGKLVTETVKINKTSGELIDHTVDGKKVEKKEPKPPKLNKITYTQGNFEPLMIMLLNDILRQLKETNYYQRKLYEEQCEVNDDEVKEAIK